VFYNNGRTQSVYCGLGQKCDLPTATYYPVSPPVMCQDRDEREICEEPQPTQAWLDAQAEKKKKKGGDPAGAD